MGGEGREGKGKKGARRRMEREGEGKQREGEGGRKVETSPPSIPAYTSA